MGSSSSLNLLCLISLCVLVSFVQCYKMIKVYPLPKSRLCMNTNDNERGAWRYHRETKKCYQVGMQGPCNELMKFSLDHNNNDYGVCDCDLSLRCGRPLIYWPHTDRCYFYGDQGPCLDGKFLVFGANQQPVCKKNICIEEEKRLPSTQNRFWVVFRGQCYRTYTTAYCAGKDEYLLFSENSYKATCQSIYAEQGVCTEGEIQKMKCYPGQKMDYYGQCTRTKFNY